MAGRPKKQYALAKNQNELKEILLEKGECELQGVGVFQLRKIKSRKYRDHWNDEIITSRPYVKIGFKPNKGLADQMQIWK